ncbi:MAG: hypothetical protein ABI665_27060 [Vicinamibacterales bacterium]
MRALLAIAATLLIANVAIAVAQRPDAFTASRENAAIAYNTTPVNTIVEEVNRKLDAGTLKFTFDPTSGYLRSALEAFALPVESQLLVYTGTSLQAPKINMQNPRAVYFTDTLAMAWVRTGVVLEVEAQDPRQGSIYYTLDQSTAGTPHFSRQLSCLSCHLSWDTLAVPGPIILSTFPRKTDKDYANGFAVDHYRDLRERWGGWYVTGRKAPIHHLGNLPLFMPKGTDDSSPPPLKATVEGRFDLNGYPTPYSDVVALMVIEHQSHAANLITRLGWEARVGHADRVPDAIRDLVDYLFFVDEAKIPERIEGSSGYAEKFQALGPKDSQGRSLREFELNGRMMRYPLSYMIYSPAIDALPDEVKAALFRKLDQVLKGEDTSAKFAHLTPAIRQAIVEILRDTKPGVVTPAA